MTKKDSRVGESLWYIWEGEDYNPSLTSSVVYYTEEVVDIENEIVRKALASSLQRDGIVDSLFQGYKLIDLSYPVHGNVGFLDGSFIPQLCDEFGKNKNDDQLENIQNVTWVEVALF